VIGRLGLSPAGEIQESISEKARRQGKSIGMVVTSQITHATPAAFAVHVKDRLQNSNIADQLFDNQWDKAPLASVLLGGGTTDLQRTDRDLVAEFTQAGYTFVSNRDELLQADASRLLGLFAPWGLARAWDRDEDVPSLADMTRAALKALEQNQQGFFLMVEGSQIDWAAHADDVAGVVSEMEDFSVAIEVALEFAARQGDTLVVITADHETGGMSLGRDDIYHWDPRPLRGMKKTPAAMTAEYLAGSEPLSQVVARSIPFTLTAEEQTRLDNYPREVPADPAYGMDGIGAYMGINEIMSRRTVTGWSSLGHTGVDVPLYAVGPGSENFRGLLQNEELGQRLQAVFLP
jgi:alkaline phosphatase